MNIPSPDICYPIPEFPRIFYLKPLLQQDGCSNIEAGDYTYYVAPGGFSEFKANVRCHFPQNDDKLIIGKFCSIARGVVFLMNGGNHSTECVSTYPFSVFGHDWGKGWNDVDAISPHKHNNFPSKGNTVLGHDVWIGTESLIMPGKTVGNGAIIGTRSVVTKDVPPYAIVGGNPAKIIRYRFPPDIIARLQALAWWDWPIEKITRHLDAVTGADVDALETANAG